MGIYDPNHRFLVVWVINSLWNTSNPMITQLDYASLHLAVCCRQVPYQSGCAPLRGDYSGKRKDAPSCEHGGVFYFFLSRHFVPAHPDLKCLARYHSYSIVALGLGVKSYKTRFTPLTSEVILETRCCISSNGIFSTSAVMASVVLTARMITHQSNDLSPFLIPVDLKSGTTVKYCHTLPSRPFFANYSLRIASDSRTASSLSLVMAPGQRTQSPGPGKGCL